MFDHQEQGHGRPLPDSGPRKFFPQSCRHRSAPIGRAKRLRVPAGLTERAGTGRRWSRPPAEFLARGETPEPRSSARSASNGLEDRRSTRTSEIDGVKSPRALGVSIPANQARTLKRALAGTM